MLNRRSLLAATAAAPLARAATAQTARARTLRFMPQAALAVLDPIFNPTTIVTTHGYCVFDTLYGADRALRPHPQMAQGHETSADGLTWTIRLREGLLFHDGEPVRAKDCVASIRRWAVRDAFGQVMMGAVNEIVATDDRTITFRLKRPFPALLDALAKPAASPCFMMPERTANTPADRAITDMTGSGPWKWVAGEFVQGSRAVYVKNERYVPRAEPADAAAGGKVVNFDRLELVWMDGGTAAAALRTGEIDWIEYPLPDLVPVLQRDRGVTTQVYDPNGFLGFLRFNCLHPPFDKVEVRRAIRDILVQPDYMQAVALEGDWRECHAVFPCGLPQVVEFPPAPRGPAAMDRARAALRDAGYRGEPIVIANPTDFPAVTQQGRVTADLMRRLGVNVDLVEADWATTIARRANKNPPAQGGWNLHNTNFPAAGIANPALSPIIRMHGERAWFGWPTDAGVEEQVQAWIDAPTAEAQATAMRRVQDLAWEAVPFAPTGLFRLRTAFRSDITGVLQGPNPFVWNLRRG
ncbi:ABC transporter substrate-binding protein [Neoroseomonas oryzicola]|uniref:ABC transporter substrate-binding protein n=1 Tax=Neoroseomonas oryzicola TaxID=535904 RepID=A0A9X9WIK7_9PROT|nr:ABC transporter substrate-binding protein [Neoroseomonas oryzicola]MBR0660167.1 ABC transporter substrate-binding protein [Neoroseomonas oryzicola]NKE20157.1 ABC transporter substrate-binding protein [Neoroseomonas oryzicola]